MKKIYLLIYLMLLFVFPALAQSTNEKKEVLRIAQQFFIALEKQDSLAFKNIFLTDAYNYYVGVENDSVRTGGQPSVRYRFRADRIIKERMREAQVSMQIHERIAMIWAPYDLWVNDKYSHCGVDVFTLLKTQKGWKIASLAYSIEKNGCGNQQKSN